MQNNIHYFIETASRRQLTSIVMIELLAFKSLYKLRDSWLKTCTPTKETLQRCKYLTHIIRQVMVTHINLRVEQQHIMPDTEKQLFRLTMIVLSVGNTFALKVTSQNSVCAQLLSCTLLRSSLSLLPTCSKLELQLDSPTQAHDQHSTMEPTCQVCVHTPLHSPALAVYVGIYGYSG